MLERYQLSVEVTEYDVPEALFWDMETDGTRYDLYFLPWESESVGKLRDVDADALVILLTEGGVRREKADASALGCLEMPVGEKELRALLERAAERLRQYKRRVIVIAQRGHTHVLRFEDIEYVSSANHTIRFHLRNGEERSCYGQLDKVFPQLDPELFIRCHQSHIVNLSYVTGHSAKAFHMTSGVVPISRSYSLQARKALEEYLFHTLPGPSEET